MTRDVCFSLTGPAANHSPGVAIAGALITVILGYVAVADWLAKYPTPTSELARLDGNVSIAQEHLDHVVQMVEDHRKERGSYPETLDSLFSYAIVLDSLGTIMVDTSMVTVAVDPVGVGTRAQRRLLYHVSPDRQQYDVFSLGRDGKAGTSDDIRARLPDSLRRTSGYQPGL